MKKTGSKRTIRLTAVLMALLMVAAFMPILSFAEEIPPADDPTVAPFTLNVGEIVGLDRGAAKYYDFNTGEQTMDLFQVAVPEGTEEVEMSFADDQICYAYGNEWGDYGYNYLASCGAEGDGSYGDGTVGQKKAIVKLYAYGEPIYYVSVQTPYDASWSSTWLYGVHFGIENPMTVKTVKKSAKAKALKKKKVTVKGAIETENAQGDVTYTKLSGPKKVSVNAKNVNIVLAKGTAKGNLKVKVAVKAAGNDSYAPKTVEEMITIKVK